MASVTRSLTTRSSFRARPGSLTARQGAYYPSSVSVTCNAGLEVPSPGACLIAAASQTDDDMGLCCICQPAVSGIVQLCRFRPPLGPAAFSGQQTLLQVEARRLQKIAVRRTLFRDRGGNQDLL